MEGVTLPEGIEIRGLRREDVDAVAAIESESFSTPWQASTFEGLLDRDGVELLVMTEPGERVIGYAVLWVVLDQAELANLALTTSRRGEGLGSHLLREVMARAGERGVRKLFLEVRASNQRAIDLYGRFGFEEVGIRRSYYQNPVEDARIMLATL